MDRIRPHAKFIQIGFPSDYGPSILQLLDDCGVERAGEFVQDSGSACRGEIAGADIVFDGDQTAIQAGSGFAYQIEISIMITSLFLIPIWTYLALCDGPHLSPAPTTDRRIAKG